MRWPEKSGADRRGLSVKQHADNLWPVNHDALIERQRGRIAHGKQNMEDAFRVFMWNRKSRPILALRDWIKRHENTDLHKKSATQVVEWMRLNNHLFKGL